MHALSGGCSILIRLIACGVYRSVFGVSVVSVYKYCTARLGPAGCVPGERYDFQDLRDRTTLENPLKPQPPRPDPITQKTFGVYLSCSLIPAKCWRARTIYAPLILPQLLHSHTAREGHSMKHLVGQELPSRRSRKVIFSPRRPWA